MFLPNIIYFHKIYRENLISSRPLLSSNDLLLSSNGLFLSINHGKRLLQRKYNVHMTIDDNHFCEKESINVKRYQT